MQDVRIPTLFELIALLRNECDHAASIVVKSQIPYHLFGSDIFTWKIFQQDDQLRRQTYFQGKCHLDENYLEHFFPLYSNYLMYHLLAGTESLNFSLIKFSIKCNLKYENLCFYKRFTWKKYYATFMQKKGLS